MKITIMDSNNFSCRKFIKGTVGTGLIVAGAGLLPSCNFLRKSSNTAFDAKGLPTVLLGKTGVHVPRLVLGLGSRFCHILTEEEACNMLNHALDNGLFYWDTARAYDSSMAAAPGKEKKPTLIYSEERIGPVVKARRKEIFLSTKITSRNPDDAMRLLEDSLKRLQTDYLDQLMIHDVKSMEDVDVISQKGNLIEILHKLKEQGLTRHIGYSGHANAEAMTAMAKRGDFDTMLIAANHWNPNSPQPRQEMAIPAAKATNMGVILMKVVRPRETIVGLNPEDLVRYALSLKGPDAVVVGMDSIDVVNSNLNILRNFKPMDAERMKKLSDNLAPFYNHQNLPWMQSGYTDGSYYA
jgi:aryl-alcohol dehydrogenase-like predicted oxidoreductase